MTGLRCLHILSILVVLSSFGCEDKLQPSVAQGLPGEDLPSQESWNSRIVFSDSGRVKAILLAGHIAVYEQKRFTLLDSNITIDFYDREGNHSSVLTARKGRIDDMTRNMEAYENVVVRSDSGTTMRTEHLYWDNYRQLIHSPLYVEIVSPTEEIQGTGFESDQALRNYTIQKVTGKAAAEGK